MTASSGFQARAHANSGKSVLPIGPYPLRPDESSTLLPFWVAAEREALLPIMVLAVLFILAVVALLAWPASIYLWHQYRLLPLPMHRQAWMALCFLGAFLLSALTFWVPMRRGVSALEELG